MGRERGQTNREWVSRPLQCAAHQVTIEIDKQAYRSRICPRMYEKFLVGNDSLVDVVVCLVLAVLEKWGGTASL